MFTCYSNMWDTIFFSELGSSLAILKGGYNLDSFMVRYQGVDWTDQASWECNGRRDQTLNCCCCHEVSCVALCGAAVLDIAHSTARIGQVCHPVGN